MKPVVVAVLVLATALAVLAIIWVAPVVGVKNSGSSPGYHLPGSCRC